MTFFDFIIFLFLINLVQGQTPSGTSNFRNYRLEVFQGGKGYDDAKAVCEGRNAWLVEIKDEETQAAVRQLTTHIIWIGLHYDSGWKWNNMDSLKYTNWATDNPRTVDIKWNNYCGASRTSDGKWYNSDCIPGLRYVCQSDLTWTLHNSKLALTIISSPKKSFADARSACTAIEKSLVSITPNALDSFLTTKLSQNGTMNYWTSGSDSETEGIWKWGDGTTFSKTDPNWKKWIFERGEPNGGTNENCLIKYANAKYKWVDMSCTAKAGYICQKDVKSGNCGSDVCLKNGSCKIKNSRYTCTCNAGYFGTKCEKGKI
uniref:macrophage mannose receptor 1-like n=1 Tax=Styela clava TaxID=7725 RepID=UPI00193A5E64|nr:macrophage mannose receptor 1-like [Styela clava]